MSDDPWLDVDRPAAWATPRLSDLCDVVRGGSPRPMGDPRYFGGPIPFVKISDVTASDGRTLRETSASVTQEGSQRSRLIRAGSLILSNSGTICVPIFLGVDACIHDGFVAFDQLSEGVSQEYLFHFFNYVRPHLRNKHKQGVTQVNLNTSIVGDIAIPLPPLPEQKRIVAKIEELFSELEAGEESLRVARRQLGVYRQSLLKQAFEGKLTEKWRAQNPDKLESPASLLARIQSARRVRYDQQLEEWESSSGRKPRPPKTTLEVDLAELPSLPSPWIWCRLSALSRVGTGVTPLRSKPEYYEEGNVPWITSTVVNEDVVHEPNGYVTQFALQDTQLQLYPAGSLIVALYGEGKTRGKVSQVAFDTTTNQALAVLVQEEECEKAIRPYLKLYLTKNYSDIRRLSSGGVQPNLNLGLIEQLPVPLCSLPEQQEIVRLLDEQFEVIERNEREIDAALKRSEALRQAILKKAFTGRLVPQDPADEPASQLLARIHAERTLARLSSRKRAQALVSS